MTISGSNDYGLPTACDADVLLGLIQLTKLRSEFTERTVHFSRYQLVSLLGWDDGGKSYRRLEESLNRWSGVTLRYKGAWWDKDGKRWRSTTFHVLELVNLQGRAGQGKQLALPLSSFTWNEVIFKSFQDGNIKRLNLDVFFALKRPITKQMYRFLDKRFYHAERVEFDLRVFACEHVGLSRKYDNAQLKRKLKPGIEELEAIGFLVRLSRRERYVKISHGEWKVVFVKRAAKAKEKETPRVEEVGELERDLINRGVERTAAVELVSNYDPKRIEEKVELFDWLREKNPKGMKNPGGFLYESIRKNYLPLRGFETKAQRAARIEGKRRREEHQKKLEAQKQAEAEAKRKEEDERVGGYLAGLSEEKRKRVEEDALRKPGFAQQLYRRAKREGRGGDEWREYSVREHVLGLLNREA